MMKSKKNWMKSLTLTPLTLLLMGNQQSCQTAPTVAHRELKKIIELEKISSRPVNMGAAGNFDFEFVANQQIITVLQDSDKFAFRLNPPVSNHPISTAGGGAVSKISSAGLGLNLSSKDSGLMNAWLGTQKATAKPAVLATESKEAWCLVNNPEAVINGSVNSFEMLGGGGLAIGFTPTGDHNVSLTGVNFQVDFLQMDLSLNAVSPMTGGLLGSSDVTSDQTKTKVGVGINLGTITLGPSFYYQTPLAKVTKTALQKAVDGLKADLDKKDWFTRVLADKDSEIIVVGGQNVNLKIGDQLAMYNELYYWTGEPCNSAMQYDGIAKDPVAYGEVVSVGEELSVVKLTKQTEENIQIGAKVKLFKMVEDIPVASPTPKP